MFRIMISLGGQKALVLKIPNEYTVIYKLRTDTSLLSQNISLPVNQGLQAVNLQAMKQSSNLINILMMLNY